MRKTLPRVYADTSVFGGVFDREFAEPSRQFLAGCRSARFSLVTSSTVREELAPAPDYVRELFLGMLPLMEMVDPDNNCLDLRDAYVSAGIVTAKSLTDALHVAIATVQDCDLLVSWNCKHIVNFRRIPLYNAVNKLRGYREIAIYTPLEVAGDEEKEV